MLSRPRALPFLTEKFEEDEDEAPVELWLLPDARSKARGCGAASRAV